jgi:hypothetical protein
MTDAAARPLGALADHIAPSPPGKSRHAGRDGGSTPWPGGWRGLVREPG